MGKRAQRNGRQVGALPVRRHRRTGRLEVLLVTTLDTGRWVIPKGWPWPGHKDHEAAAREAREEAGVRGRAAPVAIGNYVYDKRGKDGSSQPLTVDVYLLEVDMVLASWPEQGRRERMWLTPAEAASRVLESGLRSLLQELA